MSNLPITQAPAEPKLKDVLDAAKKDIFLSLNAHHIGTVQSFNAGNQTATATINYKKTYYQLDAATGLYEPVLVDYPIMTDCPVIVLGGGAGALTFPIQQGDECVVLFNDRDMDNWFNGSPGGPVATPRLHSFADAIVLVGLRSLGNVLADYDTVRAVLRNTTTMVGVGPTLVKIANADYTLNELLQELTAELQALTAAITAITVPVTSAPGTSGTPINAADITAIGGDIAATAAKIAGLLE